MKISSVTELTTEEMEKVFAVKFVPWLMDLYKAREEKIVNTANTLLDEVLNVSEPFIKKIRGLTDANEYREKIVGIVTEWLDQLVTHKAAIEFAKVHFLQFLHSLRYYTPGYLDESLPSVMRTAENVPEVKVLLDEKYKIFNPFLGNSSPTGNVVEGTAGESMSIKEIPAKTDDEKAGK